MSSVCPLLHSRRGGGWSCSDRRQVRMIWRQTHRQVPRPDFTISDKACGSTTYTRGLLTSGTLRRYIEEWSVTGLTSNPTIFDHAIENAHFYDDAIRQKSGDVRFAQEPASAFRKGSGLKHRYHSATCYSQSSGHPVCGRDENAGSILRQVGLVHSLCRPRLGMRRRGPG